MAIAVTLTQQKMKDGSTKLKLVTPYSPTLPARCRALGGAWSADAKAWYFDLRDADRVRSLCLDAFGIDPLAEPDEQPELVTVRLEMDAFNTRAAELWIFGREVVSQPGRDSSTRLGQGVVVISGGFSGGGSRANPAMNAKAGTIIEVRDVPRPLADEQIRAWADRAEKLAASADEKEARLGEPACDATIIAGLREQAAAARTAVRIVEGAPQASAVAPGTAQIGALFGALTPGDRRAVIVSMIGNLSADERAALLKEIGVFVQQGAL